MLNRIKRIYLSGTSIDITDLFEKSNIIISLNDKKEVITGHIELFSDKLLKYGIPYMNLNFDFVGEIEKNIGFVTFQQDFFNRLIMFEDHREYAQKLLYNQCPKYIGRKKSYITTRELKKELSKLSFVMNVQEHYDHKIDELHIYLNKYGAKIVYDFKDKDLYWDYEKLSNSFIEDTLAIVQELKIIIERLSENNKFVREL